MKRFLTLLLLLFSFVSWSQNKYTLSGYVRDSLSGETLIAASVTVNGQAKGIASNSYGFYSITLDEGTYTVSATFAGYLQLDSVINLNRNTEMSFNLLPRTMLEEVIVSSRRRDNNVKSPQMGKIDMSVSRIKSVPVLLGEVDLLKTLQLIPGVRNAGEGNTGLYVRGGGPDQNLIMLDDAIVYNSGHLFGFFSIFNSDAIKNISLI